MGLGAAHHRLMKISLDSGYCRVLKVVWVKRIDRLQKEALKIGAIG